MCAGRGSGSGRSALQAWRRCGARVNKRAACAAAPPRLVEEEARGGDEALGDAVTHLRGRAAARAR
jgi:hypothetical protein